MWFYYRPLIFCGKTKTLWTDVSVRHFFIHSHQNSTRNLLRLTFIKIFSNKIKNNGYVFEVSEKHPSHILLPFHTADHRPNRIFIANSNWKPYSHIKPSPFLASFQLSSIFQGFIVRFAFFILYYSSSSLSSAFLVCTSVG